MQSDLMRGKLAWFLGMAAILLAAVVMDRPSSSPSAASSLHTREPRSTGREHEREQAFWKMAQVPLPDESRPPILIAPTSLGIPSGLLPADPDSRLRTLEAPGNATEKQVALLDWFNTDPAAARDWISSRETLLDLQPALQMISESIAAGGDHGLALEWAALINSGDERDGTVARIYSAGYRQGHFSMEDLARAPLSDGERQSILNGSSGD